MAGLVQGGPGRAPTWLSKNICPVTVAATRSCCCFWAFSESCWVKRLLSRASSSSCKIISFVDDYTTNPVKFAGSKKSAFSLTKVANKLFRLRKLSTWASEQVCKTSRVPSLPHTGSGHYPSRQPTRERSRQEEQEDAHEQLVRIQPATPGKRKHYLTRLPWQWVRARCHVITRSISCHSLSELSASFSVSPCRSVATASRSEVSFGRPSESPVASSFSVPVSSSSPCPEGGLEASRDSAWSSSLLFTLCTSMKLPAPK